MSRNKMPFVAPELLKRVEALDHVLITSLFPLSFIMVENMYQFI